MVLSNVVIGSRESKLAMWQARLVVDQIKERCLDTQCDFVITGWKTLGDKNTEVPVPQLSGSGVFTKEIEKGLLEEKIHMAVHSLKDLPTSLPSGLVIGAVLERGDCRDAFVSEKFASLEDLPKGARLGTGSVRRIAQLRHFRSDLQFVPIRGNVDTRLRKMRTMELDGLILAAAGLERLGQMEVICERIPPETCLPAPGQGAVAVEIKDRGEHNGFIKRLLEPINHLPTEHACRAERSFLAEIGGGCSVPVGALGEVKGGKLTLRGVIASLDGNAFVSGSLSGAVTDASSIGAELAQKLLKDGGEEILRQFNRFRIR